MPEVEMNQEPSITFCNPVEEHIEERRRGKHKQREKRTLKTNTSISMDNRGDIAMLLPCYLFLLILILFNFIIISLF